MRSSRSPHATGSPSSRTRARRTAPNYKGRRGRQPRRRRLLQLLSRQEPRRLRRRRHGRHQRRRHAEDHAHAARLGPGAEVPPRAQGLQLPDGRAPGRHPPREAAPSRARGPRRAGARAPSTTGSLPATSWCRRRRRRSTRSTSTTSTRSGRADRDRPAADAAGQRHRHRHPLSDPGAPAGGARGPRSQGGGLPGVGARRRSRCCRCRCSRS